MCQCGPLQEGLDARIQKKEQARLQQLKEAAQAHKAQELERKYAVRNHKVHGPETASHSSHDRSTCESVGQMPHVAHPQLYFSTRHAWTADTLL